VPPRARRFEFGSTPPELDGFLAETWVGSGRNRNRIRSSGQTDHTVFFRNWGSSSIGTSVVSNAEQPPLSYPKLNGNGRWPVGVKNVPPKTKIRKVEQLDHNGTSCARGNQHKMILDGTFTTGFYPGARKYKSTVTLVVRCD
jgi:hypothetical protein